ncbi:DUF3300 domain-containing protein [Caballeronia sordidicola]|jgi:hypothetical protein|uniref:Putative membrane protein n=1 Tax=Caballeronia sordidicola TaxID=196367 RepID=A0A226X016_CABSO|nr:DUF3300 domain-containing protein [Caballeronia sordidicola]OXC76791.1 putative membrane protein [Caballeronia sordidicola]
MLAPIALYPDSLVAQILMAATYPLEVIEADRWIRDPNHAALKGEPLADLGYCKTMMSTRLARLA